MSRITIDILAHADFHGQFKEDNENPGLSRFFCCIESIRQKNPEYTILLDAGDESKCLWHGKDVYDGMALIKTDAMVLGNHEFDCGEEDLKECIGFADTYFPVLCANIIEKKTNQLIEKTKPYILLHKEGVTIGILGLASSYTPYIVEKSAFEAFEMLDSVSVIREYIPKMQEEGADIIVLLTHFPFYPEKTGELFEVYHQVKDLKIDAFIGGHIPGDFAKIIDNTAIVKGGFHGVSLPHVKMVYDTDKKQIVSRSAEVLKVLDDYKDHDNVIDTSVDKVTEPYRYYYEEEIAYAEERIPMYLNRESPLGDLFSDAIRKAANTDFAYFNCTSCSRDLNQGVITRYSISKAMYFNEYIQVTEMTGRDIYELFELVHDPAIFGNNAEIMFSGFTVKIDHTRDKGTKVLSIAQNGHEIEPERIYSVATSKYMSSGGNGTKEFAKRFAFRQLNITTHEAIIAYLKEKERIKGETDDRYIFIGTPENDHSPW